ncbi:S24/S26 family peptidase [Acetatifactor aquisgranensis]|uniref:S24/S26 family peptidase n=1 Tax=Acetatifactor aquisgranensis TaxID=2941233 RepID=UPI00203D097A|nr:S24/S26 family peptidase [Acetatifactor aquisgranensis]
MTYSTIEQELDEQGHSLFQTVGDSMEPLLHNRKSTVVIEKVSGTLKKYDVALYRRPGGEYVLHRVLKVRSSDYLICGDNRTYREPVPKEWILGVMTGFYPDESSLLISCEDQEYRRYLQTLGRRYCICWTKTLPRRIRNKIMR